jgi:flagellar basal-body rod protein FlgF
MVETSNVRPVEQITRLIEVTRAYESISKLMQQTGDMSSDAINRLGKIN